MAIITKSDTHAGIREKLQAAITAKHGSNNGDYYSDAYINDVTDDKVIHSRAGREHRGKLFASSYKNDGGKITLGEPKEVEPAYKPLSEAARGSVYEAATLQEGAYNSKTNTLAITVIKPGFNTSKSRYYLPSTLKRDGKIFEGAKMFMNHQTKAEAAARPEGRIQDWGATIKKGSLEYSESKGLTAKAIVHNKQLGEQLEALQEAGLLNEMGVSIRAAGLQSEGTVDGTKTSIVESFVAAKSVDFVTFPGAGGKVDMLESDRQHFMSVSELETVFQEADADDVDLMTVEQLAARRPDFVSQLKDEIQESMTMKTVAELEAELKESQRLLTEATTKVTALEGQVKTLTESTGKALVKAELDTQLKEAKLPEAAATRIRAQFAEAVTVEGIKPAIEAEQTYIKSLGVVEGAKPGVKRMGAQQEGAGDAADKAAKRAAYVKTATAMLGTVKAAEESADALGY